MADLGFFDANTAKQIVEHVAADKRSVQGSGPTANGLRTTGGILLAKIKDNADGKYSWIAQQVQEDGTLEDYEDWGSGDHEEEKGYARELNGAEDIAEDTIVRLWPSNNQPFYLFEVPVVGWFGELSTALSSAHIYGLAYQLYYDKDYQWQENVLEKWRRKQDDDGNDLPPKEIVSPPYLDTTLAKGTIVYIQRVSGVDVLLIAGCW